MGSSVIGRCQCGYETTVSTGCGMDGPKPSYFPGLCRACKEVVAADVCAEPCSCEVCGGPVELYDAPDLQKTRGRRTVIEEITFTEPEITNELNDGAYLCPKCGRFELRFETWGMVWD